MSNPDWMRFVLDNQPVPTLNPRSPRNEHTEILARMMLGRTDRVSDITHRLAPSYFEYMSRKAPRS